MKVKDFVNKQLILKAGNIASDYELKYGGCSQAVAGALMRTFGIRDKGLLRASNVFGAGVCRRGQTCGALLGGLLIISYLIGRDDLEHLAQHENVMAYGNILIERFKEEFGTLTCKEILEKKFNKSWNLLNPEDLKDFLKSGGHGPEGAPKTTGKAAELAAAVIIELIEENPAALGLSFINLKQKV